MQNFFENIFPLKVEHIPKRVEQSSKQNLNEDMIENLQRSKRQRKETSFGDDLYTYLVLVEPKIFYKTISSPDAFFFFGKKQ